MAPEAVGSNPIFHPRTQGYSQVGKATDFDSVIVGSSPATPAKQIINRMSNHSIFLFYICFYFLLDKYILLVYHIL